MGLGITSGSKASFVTEDFEATNILSGDVFVVAPTHPEQLDGRAEGLYHFDGKKFDFSIGPFSLYQAWIKQLSLLVLHASPEVVWGDPATFHGQPFVEIIDFSDNEGAIGPKTRRKLAEDFESYRAHLQQVRVQVEDTQVADLQQVDSRFLEIYNNFRRAFKLASDDGFVMFS